MNTSLYFALLLGFGLGVKHATDADHLVAVTTIVSEQRSLRGSAWVGLLWGIGHSASLLFAGLLVILLNVTIPASLAHALEFTVALMIVLLGGRLLYTLLRRGRRVHTHPHVHDGFAHAHIHFHEEDDAHAVSNAVREPFEPSHHHAARFTGWRSMVVGVVHGLAGSAAVTLLVLSEVVSGGSRALGMAYLLVFGVGSIGGMVLMSTVISLPLVFTTRRAESLTQPVQFAVALLSIGFGMYYAYTL